jgi:uncharacterized protein
MNKFFYLIVLVFFITSCAKKNTLLSSEIEFQKALLWEISGKDFKKPSYVFGTIHMIPSEDYFLPEGTLSAIENSEEMFFEIDMAEMNDMSNIMGVVSKLFMKNNITLKDLLSKDEYKKVSDHFKTIGIPMMMLERVKPMFLSIFASGDMSPTDISSGKLKSYELEFFEIAKSKKLPTAGLETIDFQIGLFDSISYQDQAKMLVEQMEVNDKDNLEFKELLSLYKSQDIVELFKKTSSSDEINKNEEVLISKRNKAWIPLIIKQSNVKPTFYAVGAGHLSGQNGVLSLLRKSGYTLKPVLP